MSVDQAADLQHVPAEFPDNLDLAGKVVTADAPHTQRERPICRRIPAKSHQP